MHPLKKPFEFTVNFFLSSRFWNTSSHSTWRQIQWVLLDSSKPGFTSGNLPLLWVMRAAGRPGVCADAERWLKLWCWIQLAVKGALLIPWAGAVGTEIPLQGCSGLCWPQERLLCLQGWGGESSSAAPLDPSGLPGLCLLLQILSWDQLQASLPEIEP